MKALDLKTENKPPSLLIYGPAGSGKTALVSQASGGYLFDFDGGMRTALTLADRFTGLRQAIEFDPYVDSNPQLPKAFITAKQKLLQLSQELGAGKCKYNAVVVDSLTGLCRSAQLHVMANSGGGAFNVPQIQHYGMLVNEVELILTILRSLPCLTICTAHEMLVEDGNMVLIRIMSATRSHGLNKLPWLFDEVWHSRIVPVGQSKYSYTISGAPSNIVQTRTRSNIGDVTVNELGLVGLLEKTGYKYPIGATK